MTRIIGLTGGVGMGKTAISNYLAENYHLPILDADVYAREAVQPGSPVLAKIVDRYSSKILLPDATLDRRQLGEIVFNSAKERLWLEQQIHPYVRQTLCTKRDLLREVSAEPSTRLVDAIVLVIPLLFEAQMTDLVTEIWVVFCPPDQQIQRLMQREQLSFEQAQARVSSQGAIAEKCDRADIVLDNSSTLENLLTRVDWAVRGEGRARL